MGVTIFAIVTLTLISYYQLGVVQDDLRDLTRSNMTTSSLLQSVAKQFKSIERIHYLAKFSANGSAFDRQSLNALNDGILDDYSKIRNLTDQAEEIRLNEEWFKHLKDYNLRVEKLDSRALSQTEALDLWNTSIWPMRETILAEIESLDRYQSLQSSQKQEQFLTSLDSWRIAAVVLMLLVSLTIFILGSIARAMGERNLEFHRESLLSQIKMDSAVDTANEKAVFLASMSHEIRTPLNAIIGLTDMLNEDRDASNTPAYLKALRTSADHLFHLVNNVLDFSKIEANSSTLNITRFELKAVVDRQLNVLMNTATRAETQLTSEFASDLPTHLFGDETKIGQILLNLIGNALKFSEGGRVVIAISGEKTVDGRAMLTFKVTDTGIGMSPGQIENLFTPYVQAEADTSAKFGGTGLGLVISKKLVELMSGSISVESELGSGTSFIFKIPFEIPAVESVAPTASNADIFDVPELPLLSKLNILVAEDNSTNRLVIASVLRKLQANFTIVEDGGQVIPALNKADFDLILMDCLMPVADGYQTTESIRQLERDTQMKRIPIIALTASVLDADRDRCLKSGMDAFASKPVRAESLAKIIRETLRNVA